MNKVAAMKSDFKLLLEDSKRAEEGSGLKRADLSQTSLTDGQSKNMLGCQERTGDRSALKSRRYR